VLPPLFVPPSGAGILIELLEREHANRPNNVHVVNYREVPHAVKFDGSGTCSGNGFSIVTVLALVQSLYYWDLTRFADVIVEVPTGQRAAKVTRKKSTRPAEWVRHAHAVCVLALAGYLALSGCIPMAMVVVALALYLH